MTEENSKMKVVYLSLGSNLGDRLVYLRGALQELQRCGEIKLEAVSSVYETDPIGYSDQPSFLNIVARIGTTLNPFELVKICQEIENRFERDRTVHWGPRTLDIDLLTYEDVTLSLPELTLPHPHMFEREFVQIPLREVDSGEIGCSESVRPLYAHWYNL